MEERIKAPNWLKASGDHAAEDIPQEGVLYLLGATTQVETQAYVRANCTSSEVARIPEIMNQWQTAALAFAQLAATDAAATECGGTFEIEDGQHRVTQISADPLFQVSFSQLPISFGSVPIDNLISPQRTIDLGYVAKLRADLRRGADPIEFCLALRNNAAAPAHLTVAPNVVVYGSANTDFRFLGGYTKEIDASDLAASGGGLPAGAIVLLVGYGTRCVNVLKFSNRVVLNNGFHRVYALRAEGHTHVPVVIQHITNPNLEFPPNLLGLPKEYLLSHPRPALAKDFFDDRVVTRLATIPKQHVVKVSWGAEQFNVPLANGSATHGDGVPEIENVFSGGQE